MLARQALVPGIDTAPHESARGRVEALFRAPLARGWLDDVGDLERWCKRPLQARYAFVFFDPISVRVKEHGLLCNREISLALGITEDGGKDIIGCWTDESHGIGFWTGIAAELKMRGVKHIDIAITEDDAAAEIIANCFLTSFVSTHPKFATNTENLTVLPPALRQICMTTTAADSLVEKRRRRGLVKRYTFASAEAAVRELVFVLQDANATWKVSPQRWGLARKALEEWQPPHIRASL